jgi:hypothetical protein
MSTLQLYASNKGNLGFKSIGSFIGKNEVNIQVNSISPEFDEYQWVVKDIPSFEGGVVLVEDEAAIVGRVVNINFNINQFFSTDKTYYIGLRLFKSDRSMSKEVIQVSFQVIDHIVDAIVATVPPNPGDLSAIENPLIAWHEAGSTDNIYNGTTPILIKDLSGNRHDIIRVPGKEPVYEPTGLNGRPALSFNGTNITGQYMNITDGIEIVGSFTMVHVLAFDDLTLNQTRGILGKIGTSVKFGKYLADKLICRVSATDDSDITINLGASSDLLVMYYQRDSNNNGSYDFQFQGAFQSLGQEVGNATFDVFGRGQSDGEFFKGKWCASYYFEGVLSQTDRHSLRDIIHAKYAPNKRFVNGVPVLNSNNQYQNI